MKLPVDVQLAARYPGARIIVTDVIEHKEDSMVCFTIRKQGRVYTGTAVDRGYGLDEFKTSAV